jgi:hypothetical protein
MSVGCVAKRRSTSAVSPFQAAVVREWTKACKWGERSKNINVILFMVLLKRASSRTLKRFPLANFCFDLSYDGISAGQHIDGNFNSRNILTNPCEVRNILTNEIKTQTKQIK